MAECRRRRLVTGAAGQQRARRGEGVSGVDWFGSGPRVAVASASFARVDPAHGRHGPMSASVLAGVPRKRLIGPFPRLLLALSGVALIVGLSMLNWRSGSGAN